VHLTNRPEPRCDADRSSNKLTLCSGKETCDNVLETVPPPPASGIRVRTSGCPREAPEAPAKAEGTLSSPGVGALSKQHLEQAITTYLPLVERVVRQLARRLPANVQRDDLISAGVFGLADSLRRNGGDQGEGFQWYARTRIRGAIFDELRAQDWLSRRARDRISAASDANDESSAVTTTMVSLEDVIATQDAAHFATDADDPLEVAETRSQQRVLAEAVMQLPERERQIVGRHYFDGVKLKDIGAELGVSEPRVSQLHARALGRLRAILVERPARAQVAPVARPASASTAMPASASTARPVAPVASTARRSPSRRSARQSLPSSSALPLMGASSA
jgi:RNA polymerase sigma factor FliA